MLPGSHLLVPLAIAASATSVIVFLRYLVACSFFAYCTKVHMPRLYQDRGPQIRREIAWSAISAVIYGVPVGIALWAWNEHGLTLIYTDPSAYPVWWLPLSALVYLAIQDSWFYLTHRLMHAPALFRACHYVHHQSNPATGWASMSFHPWEALTMAPLVPVLLFFLPIHVAALGFVTLVMTVFGITNHLGWEIWPSSLVKGRLGRAIITASHHDRHHRDFRCNYGLYFRFWDHVCGTDRGLGSFGPGR